MRVNEPYVEAITQFYLSGWERNIDSEERSSLPQAARALVTTATEIEDLFTNALGELQPLRQVSKEYLEKAEARLGVYFGRLLIEDVPENILRLFTGTLVQLEHSNHFEQKELNNFCKGFLSLTKQKNSYKALEDYCSSYKTRTYLPDDGNPYASSNVRLDPPHSSTKAWLLLKLGKLFG
jgi:hypothetical protein